MGFWETITGRTADGQAADGMPEDVKFVYSIKGHLYQLINIHRDTHFLYPDMGLGDFPDVITTLPSSIAAFQKDLKEMILKYDKRIKDIYFSNWHVEKNIFCPACSMAVVIKDDEVLRFRIEFAGIGNNRIYIQADDDEE